MSYLCCLMPHMCGNLVWSDYFLNFPSLCFSRVINEEREKAKDDEPTQSSAQSSAQYSAQYSAQSSSPQFLETTKWVVLYLKCLYSKTCDERAQRKWLQSFSLYQFVIWHWSETDRGGHLAYRDIFWVLSLQVLLYSWCFLYIFNRSSLMMDPKCKLCTIYPSPAAKVIEKNIKEYNHIVKETFIINLFSYLLNTLLIPSIEASKCWCHWMLIFTIYVPCPLFMSKMAMS